MVEANLVLSSHSSNEALAMLDEILPIYAAAEAEQMSDPFFWPDQYVARLENTYAPSPRFELVAGRLENRLVGYAFGRPRENSGEIWRAVADALPDIVIPDEPLPVFIFCEFHVHPQFQRLGYGGQIHRALLANRPEELAHLLVRKDNVAARSAYFSWGWRLLGDQQPFPDAPVFDQLVRALPLG